MHENIIIDAHVHLALDGIDFNHSRQKHQNGPDSDVIREVLRKYNMLGIRCLRDGGDNLYVSLRARELALEENMILKTPVYAIYKEGRYGRFLGRPVADMTEFKGEFTRLLSYKPDHLKIPFTGIMDFDHFGKVDGINFTFDELYYMIQSAKDNGLPTMVHAYTAEAVRMAVLAGADTIEHGYYLTEDELHLMLEHETIWIPTLAPLGNLINQNDPRFSSQTPTIKLIYEAQKAKVNKAFELGVRVAAGSDAGSPHVYHGQGIFDEIAHLTGSGIDKEKVLSSACLNGIKALNLTLKEIDDLTANMNDTEGS